MSRLSIPVGEVPLIGQQPQHIGFGCAEHDGHLASPIVVPMVVKAPNGVAVIQSFGGLTKLEHGALQIAAAVAGAQAHDAAWGQEQVAEMAATLAQAVLDECAKRQPHLHAKTQ